MFTTLNKQKK